MRLKELKKHVIVGQAFLLLASFSSTYWQVHGLFGERGLVPVATKLNCDDANVFHCRLPILHIFSSFLKLSPSVSLQLAAFIGIILSIGVILVKKLRNAISFVVLFVLLRTIQDAGDVFFFTDADAFLLESTGYVTFLAWFGDGPTDIISLFAILCFGIRTILSIGIAKIKNDTWFKFAAFDQYFELIPLPTSLSRDVHFAPRNIKQYFQIFLNFAELVIPIFVLFPVRKFRHLVFGILIVVQFFNFATGNFGTFYLNIIVVFLASLNFPRFPKNVEFLAAVSVTAMMGFYIQAKLPWTINGINDQAEIILSQKFGSVPGFITESVKFVIMGATLVFIPIAIMVIFKIMSSRNMFRHIVHLFVVVTFVGIISAYGTISILQLDKKTFADVLKQKPLIAYHKTFKQYGMSGSYNNIFSSFGSPGRPEIVIEGSTNVDGPWQEIKFHAKPGPISKVPRTVAPHIPRIDNQMWVAAQGTYQQNPFFLSLVHHLMENTTEVVRLIEDYPFTNKSEPMNFVKATLYMYHYEKLGEKNFWKRNKQEEYMPVFNKGNPAIIKFLQESGNLVKDKTKEKYVNGDFGKSFKKFHRKASQHNQTSFVHSILFGVFFIHAMNRFK